MFILTLRTTSAIPIEVDGIIPERLVGLSEEDLAELPILHGNRRDPLGKHFDIEATDESVLFIAGHTGNLKRIGAGMTSGFIFVEGDAGMHAGACMTGGTLEVLGHAGDWCGAEMRGGRIAVGGNAGNQLGAAYRGSRQGMRGGAIIVRGNAGDEAGLLMRRGLIVVEGNVGAFAGASMIAGTLVALGGGGSQCGAGMKRGTIVVGGDVAALPDTFRYSCDIESAWLGLFTTQMAEYGIQVPQGKVKCYRGDALTGSRGEILLLPNAHRFDSSAA